MDCECGCGEQTERKFKSGHDQRLRARLEKDIGGLLNLRYLVETVNRHKGGKMSDAQLVGEIRRLYRER